MSRYFPVHLKYFCESMRVWCSRPVRFEECLLALLGSSESAEVCFEVQDDKLIISPAFHDQNSSESVLTNPKGFYGPVKLTHPEFCPIYHIHKAEHNILTANLSRGITAAVCVLLESCDEQVLISRRSATMRTFPHVWVPPGGHIEPGETLESSCLRELEEEVGLKINSCQNIRILGSWESVYPPFLSLGTPQRHHLVIYLIVTHDLSHSDITQTAKLNPKEVDALMWIGKEQAAFIADKKTQPPEPLYIYFPQSDGKLMRKETKLPQVCLDEVDLSQERISTGTKYALDLWLKSKVSA